MKRIFPTLDLPEAVRAALTVQQFLLPLPRRVEAEAMHLTLLNLARGAASGA